MPLIVLLPQAGLELLCFLFLLFRSQSRLVAETIAMRAQSEVCVKCRHPRRHLPDAKRVTLVILDRFFGIRHDLPLLIPGTVRKWAKKIATLAFWLRSMRRGRPPLPERAIAVIRQLARENPLWKIREIAKKATAYLGLSICAGTVRRYLPLGDPRRRRKQHTPSERWSTFIRNHANAVLACDFAVTRTLWGGTLYVIVVMEIGSRRILHTNVTAHPSAEWTIQQFRECVPAAHAWKYLVHDRDSIFSRELDSALRSFGIEPLRTPVRSPKANSFCERLIGTMRGECLDWIIPFGEEHLRPFVREWATHYNRARQHTSLGLGVPEPMSRCQHRRSSLVITSRTATRDREADPGWTLARIPARTRCLKSRSTCPSRRSANGGAMDTHVRGSEDPPIPGFWRPGSRRRQHQPSSPPDRCSRFLSSFVGGSLFLSRTGLSHEYFLERAA